MGTTAGLWIDQKEAVIVFVSEQGEETHLVTHESPAGPSGAASDGRAEAPAARGDETGATTSSRQRRRFYDDVAARLAAARTVLIFGLGEATREVEARLDRQDCSDRIIGVGTAEKMTAPEIASEVRQRFGV